VIIKIIRSLIIRRLTIIARRSSTFSRILLVASCLADNSSTREVADLLGEKLKQGSTPTPTTGPAAAKLASADEG